MKIAEIDTVCFVGAGTMGCFNALMAASGGYTCVIYDISQTALEQAGIKLPEMAAFLSSQGLIPADELPKILSRICVEADLGCALQGAGLVSESVAENLDIKRALHATLDSHCGTEVLITTNTSSLLASDIFAAVEHKARVAALHSHLAATLFDIVRVPGTSEHTVDILQRYVTSIGGVPLVLQKENPGYVINAILGPLLGVSLTLVIEGTASIEEVDAAWMSNQQSAIGPFGLMDLFGLNVLHDSWQKPRTSVAHMQSRVLAFLAPYIDNNMLGAKTGTGFYNYPGPTYSQQEFITRQEHDPAVYDALVCTLIASALVIAADGIAKPEDIDRAWTVSFKVSLGPFGLLEGIGVDKFTHIYTQLVASGLASDQILTKVTNYLQSSNRK